MNTTPKVSIIIPTMATRKREMTLKRSIDSIRNSSSQLIEIIVVVNGKRFDQDLCGWLKMQPDVRFEYISAPSLPNALLRGRELVEAPFFSILDDDDEYIGMCTDVKLTAMASFPHADLLVTNGYLRQQGGVDELLYSNLHNVPSQPLISLFEATWLNSCNALYRSSSINSEFFHDYHQYIEYTWLAFKIAMAGKNICVLDEPTFRCFDTPGSLSKSDAYKNAKLRLYNRMLSRRPPREVTRLILKKISSAYHDESVRALHEGHWMRALIFHLRSLALPNGHRYFSYGRRLLPGWPK